MSTPVVRRQRPRVPGRRLLTGVPVVVLLVVAGADLASVALVKVSAADNAAEAARAGVGAIQYEREATPQTAQAAYDAAVAVAEFHRLDIDESAFVVHRNGTVELTARRSSPTVLFKHLPGLRDLTETTVSVSAARINW